MDICFALKNMDLFLRDQRCVKTTTNYLSLVSIFQSFLRGETQIPKDEAFKDCIEVYLNVFLRSGHNSIILFCGLFAIKRHTSKVYPDEGFYCCPQGKAVYKRALQLLLFSSLVTI